MNRTCKYFLQVALMLCGGCLCVVAMAGCTVSTHDDAEWSIFWGTKVGISSTSKKTTGDTSWAKTEVPALEEWFLKDDAVVGPPSEVKVVPVTPVPEPVRP